MAKTRLVFQCLLVIFLLSVVNVKPLNAMQLADESTSNQFTHPDTVNPNWTNYQEIPESYELAAENNQFKLYGDKTTLAFKVVDKRSGYVWHSNLDQVNAEDKLNKTWTAFARSGISIDYLDQKAISKRASITNANHTLEFKPIDQGFEASLTFTDLSISMSVMVRLEEHGVSVEIPYESIKQDNADYKLGLLYVYPFFGATIENSVPGYMFIPDGAGSLIRFSATTKATNMFYGKYYGSDLGMLTELPYDPKTNRAYKLSIPVFGMVHGYRQNAFICIVEQGASYGQIEAHPAGVITKFNFIYNAFVYNESYFQATNRSGAGVTTLQQKTNVFNVKMHYRFLTQDDSDYVGMARSYQQYLVEKGDLKQENIQSGDIGIRLEFLGGEKEKVLIWQRLISMTTIRQMNEILNALQIKNPDVVYYGWQPLGASTMPPKSVKLDGGLGTKAQLRSVIEKVSANGGNFYLYLDPQAAIKDEKGYSPRYDLAMSITNLNLEGFNRNKVNYYLNNDAVYQRYSALSNEVFSHYKAGLALDDIGSMLYSDYKGNDVISREDTIARYQQMLAEHFGRISFYAPNDYMFRFMKAYYDIPLTNSGYIYTTDTVPFLQIVFAGFIPYFGTAMNFSSDSQADLLRHIDFGVYPSYFLSYDVTAKILKTKSNWIYSSSYHQWAEVIDSNYQWLNGLLAPVKGQAIVARQVLTEGVVATTYANGKQIVVNYNDQQFSDGDLTVQGKDAVIREVLP